MKIYFLLFLFFLPTLLPGQSNRKHSIFDFIADTAKMNYVGFHGDTSQPSTVSITYDKAIDSQYHLNQGFDFQFRFRRYYLQNSMDNVFVLGLKDKKWTAKYFDRNNGIYNMIVFTERIVDQSKVNQLWTMLVDNNVLTLPEQVSLSERLITYHVDTMNLQYGSMRRFDITDGIAYGFDLYTSSKHRHYSYHCPQAYLDKFGNVKELYNAVVIIMLIQKFLGEVLRVC